MRREGATLLEVLVSVTLLALIMVGLLNVVVSGKRLLYHSRSRMGGGELGKVFLDILPQHVREDQWNGSDYNSPNMLRLGTRSGTSQAISGVSYSPTYNVVNVPGDPTANRMRKVQLTITWNEPTPF